MKRLTIAATMAAALATGAATAQSFPSQPVTIVVPYGAGGVTDGLSREVAGALQEAWGQPVIVENRPGGGSMIGSAHVATSTPDGYTLLFTTSAFATGPAVLPDIPFDPRADIQPIGLLGYIPMVFVAGPSTEATNILEFIDEARERELFAATAGLGTTTHFTVEMLMQAAGIVMETVHYSGGGDAAAAVLGGHADIYASTPGSTLDNIRAGNLRGLATPGDVRISVLPDMPSTAELGLEGINATFWVGLFAPAGVPDDVAQAINDGIATALENPSVAERLENINFQARPNSVAEFEAQIERELTYWAELAAARGLAPN